MFFFYSHKNIKPKIYQQIQSYKFRKNKHSGNLVPTGSGKHDGSHRNYDSTHGAPETDNAPI